MVVPITGMVVVVWMATEVVGTDDDDVRALDETTADTDK